MKRGKYRKGIFAVIYSFVKEKPYYLILKRKLHWKGWEFPKGGIKSSEKEKRAVTREIKEETGLNIKEKNIKKFNVAGKYKYGKKLPDREGLIGQTYVLYCIETQKKRIKINKLEHSSYKWMNFKKAVKMLKWPNQRRCLKIVNKLIKTQK